MTNAIGPVVIREVARAVLLKNSPRSTLTGVFVAMSVAAKLSGTYKCYASEASKGTYLSVFDFN